MNGCRNSTHRCFFLRFCLSLSFALRLFQLDRIHWWNYKTKQFPSWRWFSWHCNAFGMRKLNETRNVEHMLLLSGYRTVWEWRERNQKGKIKRTMCGLVAEIYWQQLKYMHLLVTIFFISNLHGFNLTFSIWIRFACFRARYRSKRMRQTMDDVKRSLLPTMPHISFSRLKRHII